MRHVPVKLFSYAVEKIDCDSQNKSSKDNLPEICCIFV